MKLVKSKIKLIVISSFFIIFTGCSQSAFKYFDKSEEFVQNAQYTQVLKIVENDIVKAMANITYLNSADSEKWDNGKQNFIIGQYIIEKENANYSLDLIVEKRKKIQLDKDNIEYEIIKYQPSSTKVIDKKDSLYSQIPFRNSWAEYKLVTFEDIKEDKRFSFVFKDNKQNSVKTTFIKE